MTETPDRLTGRQGVWSYACPRPATTAAKVTEGLHSPRVVRPPRRRLRVSTSHLPTPLADVLRSSGTDNSAGVARKGIAEGLFLPDATKPRGRYAGS